MPFHRRDENKQSVLRAALIAAAAAGLLAAGRAAAQAGASVALASEYSARGVSLSNGHSTLQLSLSYDAAQGWYAGVFAVPGLALAGRPGVVKRVVYGGYARRLPSGLSWEAGASSTSFSHLSAYGYHEVFLGMASDRLSGRIHFAPAYYGYGGRVAYAELNGLYPLGETLSLIGHAGVLHGLGGRAEALRDRLDLRLAIGFDVGRCQVQLAWIRSRAFGPGTPRSGERQPRALALNASYSF